MREDRGKKEGETQAETTSFSPTVKEVGNKDRGSFKLLSNLIKIVLFFLIW